MSFAFGEPPDSGVKVSPRAAGAVARRASSAAASRAYVRRRGMPVGKARGSYLRPPRTLHFVPSVSGRSSPLRLELELAHAEAVDLELPDPHLPDRRPSDRQPSDREPADRQRAHGQRPERLGPDRVRAGSAEVACGGHAPWKAGSRFSRKASAPSWKSRVRARACWSSASSV